MSKRHVVRVQLKGYPNEGNKIWIDGQEIRNVTSFGLEAGLSKTSKVIIAFIADVEGEFEGAVNLLEDRTAELPEVKIGR